MTVGRARSLYHLLLIVRTFSHLTFIAVIYFLTHEVFNVGASITVIQVEKSGLHNISLFYINLDNSTTPGTGSRIICEWESVDWFPLCWKYFVAVISVQPVNCK